jgi:hypothetical protein
LALVATVAMLLHGTGHAAGHSATNDASVQVHSADHGLGPGGASVTPAEVGGESSTDPSQGPAPEADLACCCCVSAACMAALLPTTVTVVRDFPERQMANSGDAEQRSGFEPEGLRRPPRPRDLG